MKAVLAAFVAAFLLSLPAASFAKHHIPKPKPTPTHPRPDVPRPPCTLGLPC